jgi:transglutaminase-like putative cysteine protease
MLTTSRFGALRHVFATLIAVVASAAALLAPAQTCLAQGEPDERWFIVEMLGQRAGWMRSVRTTTPETVTSVAEMRFSLKRGQIQLDISMDSAFVETPEGKPISMESVQKFGATSVKQSYTFKEDGVELTTTQAGQTRTSQLELPEGTWLPPAAAERYVRQRLKSGAEEIVVRTVDPLSGITPITSTRAGFERTTVECMGKTIDATRCSVEMSNVPGIKSTEFVDGEGELVKSETAMQGMSIVMVRATEEDARKEMDAPEVMVQTFVTPDRSIRDARTTTKAVYKLSVADGDLSEFPQTGSQHVAVLSPSEVRLTIDTSMPTPAPEGDVGDADLLAATAMADASDAKIQELAQAALKNAGESQAERAEALRRFVFSYIKKKNLGVGFATATEVARTREGDCTEHGVLLVALLRASGIPARAATGLIYADSFAGGKDIFGYHMWAQALITVDGVSKWVDLDGTLPPKTPYDATHITLAVTPLNEGDGMSGMASIAPLLGRLQISVESFE